MNCSINFGFSLLSLLQTKIKLKQKENNNVESKSMLVKEH